MKISDLIRLKFNAYIRLNSRNPKTLYLSCDLFDELIQKRIKEEVNMDKYHYMEMEVVIVFDEENLVEVS